MCKLILKIASINYKKIRDRKLRTLPSLNLKSNFDVIKNRGGMNNLLTKVHELKNRTPFGVTSPLKQNRHMAYVK